MILFRYCFPIYHKSPNDLFSEIIAPMVLKFHMQHDEAAGLQNDKIQVGWESNIAAVAKNS